LTRESSKRKVQLFFCWGKSRFKLLSPFIKSSTRKRS